MPFDGRSPSPEAVLYNMFSIGSEASLSRGMIMSKNRYGIGLLLVLGLSNFSACNEDQPLGKSENRTVTTFGGTCGRWQTTDLKTGVVTFVVATCGPGLLRWSMESRFSRRRQVG